MACPHREQTRSSNLASDFVMDPPLARVARSWASKSGRLGSTFMMEVGAVWKSRCVRGKKRITERTTKVQIPNESILLLKHGRKYGPHNGSWSNLTKIAVKQERFEDSMGKTREISKSWEASHALLLGIKQIRWYMLGGYSMTANNADKNLKRSAIKYNVLRVSLLESGLSVKEGEGGLHNFCRGQIVRGHFGRVQDVGRLKERGTVGLLRICAILYAGKNSRRGPRWRWAA
ncbi:hypothetical protein C8R43DRAFT_954992 [Mycena crocata]|nr:hypothetical protein C8R43DRAFT_954992 [Mycena crocata]